MRTKTGGGNVPVPPPVICSLVDVTVRMRRASSTTLSGEGMTAFSPAGP